MKIKLIYVNIFDLATACFGAGLIEIESGHEVGHRPGAPGWFETLDRRSGGVPVRADEADPLLPRAHDSADPFGKEHPAPSRRWPPFNHRDPSTGARSASHS